MNRPHRLVTALLLVATATAGTAHADDASRKEALSKASSAGHLVLSMAKAVAAHESADVDHLKKWVGFCNEAADRLVADGAGPDTLITVDETQVALGAYKTEVCAKVRQQYLTDFYPGLYEWPALLRKLDKLAPDYAD